MNEHAATAGGLPEALRGLFWDQDFDRLNWPDDRDAVTARVLASGGWSALCWLRGSLGDEALRSWLVRRRGRGLDARRLRYWQVILDLPTGEVDRWLALPARQIWDRRLGA